MTRPDWWPQGVPFDSDPVVELVKNTVRMVDKLPPVPRCFIARHDVPFGRVFRMWNTRGELLVYVNRGYIEDLPRREKTGLKFSSWEVPDLDLFGVPVVYE